MATATQFSPALAASDARSRASSPRRGLLARLFDALAEDRRRDADLRVAADLKDAGGRMTDQVERETPKFF